MKINSRIQQKQDLSTRWSSINPTLLSGEFGYETDTGLVKIGDGESSWNDLPYLNGNESYFYFDSEGELHLQKDDATVVTSENVDSYVPSYFHYEGSDGIATGLTLKAGGLETESFAVVTENTNVSADSNGLTISSDSVKFEIADKPNSVFSLTTGSWPAFTLSSGQYGWDAIVNMLVGEFHITATSPSDHPCSLYANHGFNIEADVDFKMTPTVNNVKLATINDIPEAPESYFTWEEITLDPITTWNVLKPKYDLYSTGIYFSGDMGYQTTYIHGENGDINIRAENNMEIYAGMDLSIHTGGDVYINDSVALTEMNFDSYITIPEPQFDEGSAGLSTDQQINAPAVNTNDLWATKVETTEITTNTLNIVTNSESSDDAYGGSSSLNTSVNINESGISMAAPTVAIAGDVGVSSDITNLLINNDGVHVSSKNVNFELHNIDWENLQPVSFSITNGSWPTMVIDGGSNGGESNVNFFTSDFNILNVGFSGPLGITSYSGVKIDGKTDFEYLPTVQNKPLATKEYVDSKGGYPEIIDLTI